MQMIICDLETGQNGVFMKLYLLFNGQCFMVSIDQCVYILFVSYSYIIDITSTCAHLFSTFLHYRCFYEIKCLRFLQG